ncbi:MAG: acyl-CoA dehydratase activase [Chloroflexota bacterium]
MKALGIDIGSLTTKVVALDGNDIIASGVFTSGEDTESSAKAAVEQTLNQSKLSFDNDWYIVATGAGGKSISFNNQQKNMATCLARGINYLLPSVRMLIDMGAESGTVIKVNQRGRLSDWATHDKCAAGTGMFLQQMARLMQMPLQEMSEFSFKAKAKADITSTCAVFAESEVISHVHRIPPTPKEEIVAGIYLSVVRRVMALCKRTGIEKDVAITGGVALNRGLVRILEEEMGFKVLVSEQPQVVAALGAAIIARENIEKGIA